MRLVDTNLRLTTLKWKEEDIALRVINSINANDSNASLNLILITHLIEAQKSKGEAADLYEHVLVCHVSVLLHLFETALG